MILSLSCQDIHWCLLHLMFLLSLSIAAFSVSVASQDSQKSTQGLWHHVCQLSFLPREPVPRGSKELWAPSGPSSLWLMAACLSSVPPFSLGTRLQANKPYRLPTIIQSLPPRRPLCLHISHLVTTVESQVFYCHYYLLLMKEKLFTFWNQT